MPVKKIKSFIEVVRGFALAAWLLLVVAVTIAFIQVGNVNDENRRLVTQTKTLAIENANRITEIQASRTASCKHTYRSMREVFQPFFRPAKLRTPKENSDLRKFNRIINQKVAACDKQTAPKKIKVKRLKG